MHNKTVILFFTRPKTIEAKEKQLHCKSDFNKIITSGLIDHTIAVIKKSEIPYEIYFDNLSGQSFGTKLANAVSSVFEKNYEKVLIVGNDCPALTPQILLSAKKDLEHNDLVAGPDVRGGLYLLGISKRIYNANLFAALPWQQSILFNLIKLKTLDKGISFVQLKKLKDINFENDVIDILNYQSKIYDLYNIVKSIVFYAFKQQSYPILSLVRFFATGLRAPPAFI